MNTNLPSITVIIPTRDRLEDLKSLLKTLIHQVYSPNEIIIVDDSPSGSAKEIAVLFSPQFASLNCNLKLVSCSGQGLTKARNLGVSASKSEIIFFTDDDTELPPEVLVTMAAFFKDTSSALGIQLKIVSTRALKRMSFAENLENVLYRVFMLNYFKKNSMSVQRSGFSIFPVEVTKVFSAERLSGCCCYRREVFDEFRFDTNLKRWGFMEDLDFSYRLYKKNPCSLYVLPWPEILHKTSNVARLPSKLSIQMKTIYWFYVFFKDVFDDSIRNLLAFMWALTGNLALTVLSLISRRKNAQAWWSLIHLLSSYTLALRNFKGLLSCQLEFFNKILNDN
jgi:glycosyltransferase involved in cell wall biosynthesis